MRSILIVLVLAVGAPALAQPVEGRGRGDQLTSDTPLVGVSFGPDAEVEIRSYFRTNPLEPQDLPPGIARNLERGKPLPPGIAKRYPPDALLVRLPAYPGHEIIVAGDDLLLVAVATQIVVDVLSDVL